MSFCFRCSRSRNNGVKAEKGAFVSSFVAIAGWTVGGCSQATSAGFAFQPPRAGPPPRGVPYAINAGFAFYPLHWGSP